MFTYVSLGLLAVTVLFVLINVLKGLIRGIKKTIGTLVAIIISAIISAIVTAVICNPSSELLATVVQLLKDVIGEGTIQDIFAINEIDQTINYYISMIAAPFVFVILYIVLSLIVGIIVRIALNFIPPHKKPRAVVHRLGGVGVGAVCGILVSLLLLMPIVGVLDIVISVTQMDALESVDGMDEIADIFEDAEEDLMYSIYSSSTGWMFDSVASVVHNGERIYLKNEAKVIIAIVGNISVVVSNEGQLADAQIKALNAAIDTLDGSPLLKSAVAGVVSEMTSKWCAGKSFMGIEKIDAGEMLNPMLNKLFEVMSTSDETNIVADMHTLADILGVLVEHDIFSAMDDTDSLVNKIADEGVIAELMSVANSNDRMSVLSDEITTLSVQALVSTIGIPKSHDERYNLLMCELAEVISDSHRMSEDDRINFVTNGISEALDNYGVEVDESVVESLASSMMIDFTHIQRPDDTDVREFFLVYAVANGNANSSASISGYDYLSSTKYEITVNSDGTISIGGVVLKNYTASNYVGSMAYSMGMIHVDLGDAAYLYSSKAMKSSLVTTDDILACIKKYKECSDPMAEAEKLSDILATAINIFESDGEKHETATILAEIGELLDMMAATEIFGNSGTAEILTAVFQTKDVRDEIGLSSAEMNNFAEKLNNTANGDAESYATTMQTVSSTVDVFDKLTDDGTPKEERQESTKKLLSDMSPENAELMGSMATPSMMTKYGAKSSKAEIVSSSVSTLLNNMANFQPDIESEEGQAKYDSEAEAVNTLLLLAMDSADSKANSLFTNTEGEDSRTGHTAEEFIELFVDSEVVGNTLVTTVYEEGNTENPYGLSPTTQDKEKLSNAIQVYYEENKGDDDDQLMLKLNAVAILSGMEPVFDIDY